jgi:HEAT repeat protein
VSLEQAAQEADALAEKGAEQELAALRSQWDDELEAAARSQDFRQRAVAYRAIAQFRFRQKIELLRRGLEDESPACRGSALLSLEKLSRDHPSVINGVRPLLHELATRDPNDAVRRLAIMALRNGSAQRDTIAILAALGENDEEGRELRETATKVALALRRKAGPSK